MTLAAITASELWVSVHRAASPARAAERRRRIEQFLAAMPVVPFDSTVARVHAELWAALLSRGQMIGTHDLLIAATAVAHGYAVLTDNVADFGRVPRLTVHQPAWSRLGP